MLGLVAQTIHITIQIGVKWIARTPPKRQVEGSNPSEPANYKGSYAAEYRLSIADILLESCS
jgi:hypothetical protein